VASTYQVTNYAAWVREVDEALTEKFTQYIAIWAYSAANTEATYDLGLYVTGSLGTFWTAAIADTTPITVNVNGVPTATTQGALATAALQLFQVTGPLANSTWLSIENQTLASYQKLAPGATLAADQYTLTVSNNAPVITFYSGSGGAPTATGLFLLSWDLPPGNHGVKTPVTYF
jgi:hypothetical protein